MASSYEMFMFVSWFAILMATAGLILAIITIRKYRTLFLREKARYDALYIQHMELLSRHVAKAGNGDTVH